MRIEIFVTVSREVYLRFSGDELPQPMKNVLRAIQTLFPSLHDLRFKTKFLSMKLSGAPHEEDFKAIRLFSPERSRLFVDVGSNRGEAITSMRMMSQAMPRIVGFEPNELVFEKLAHHVADYPEVEVHNVGLADAPREEELYIPFYRKWMFDGLASFKYEEARDWLEHRLWRYDERKLTVKKTNCRIRTLDEYELAPDFIKIDVQGYELQVLQGGAKTIEAHLPIILIESIDASHKDFLSSFGYGFYHYADGRLLPGDGRLNTFCVESRRYAEL